MTVIIHKQYGEICGCHCHRDEYDWIEDPWNCCDLINEKYINDDGTLNEEEYLEVCERRGRILPYLPSFVCRPMPEFDKYTFPIIRNTWKHLPTIDIVRAQPMTGPASLFDEKKKKEILDVVLEKEKPAKVADFDFDVHMKDLWPDHTADPTQPFQEFFDSLHNREDSLETIMFTVGFRF